MMRSNVGCWQPIAVAVYVLCLFLTPLPAGAQAKCCECGTVAGDQDTTAICFTGPGNANDCGDECGKCSLEVSEFNANDDCDMGESAPRCAGRTSTDSDGGTNCPAPPPDCSSNADCQDDNACTTDSCVNEKCVNDPITCPSPRNSCVASTCSTSTGCGFMDNDGASCTDHNVCTEQDVCSGGTCTGSPIANCVQPSAAPVASAWGLSVLATSLFILAVMVLRRRVVRP